MKTLNERVRLILGNFIVKGSLELRLASGKRIPRNFWDEPYAEEIMLDAEVALLKWVLDEYPQAEVDNNMPLGTYGVKLFGLEGHEVPRHLLREFASRSKVEGDMPQLNELPEVQTLSRALSNCCGEGASVVGRFQAVKK